MDHDTTKILFRKIKTLDPENASKIMGFILIQDLGEIDLMRLALGPETLLQSLVFKARTHLGLSSNTFSTPPLNPISRPNHSQNLPPQSSPRLIPRNGLMEFSKKVPSWSPASSPKSSPFLSYDNIHSGSHLVPPTTGDNNNALIDENQMSDYFSFLNDSSSSKNEDFVGHRRSFSASDACFETAEEAGGFGGMGGFKTCLYFARGFCKNGDNCKFSHGVGGLVDNIDVNGAMVGSPSKMDLLYHQHEEMMRMRATAHQQRLAAAQLLAGVSSPLPYEKNMNFLLQQQTDARAAALMLDEEICKFAQGRSERNEYLGMGFAEKTNSASKQIYLTFPAESSFRDEDVSTYFSMFGPVQDVRIPYQQKRMFGFVTFVHPETVKLILARGNPHYICDSRVLVKPYKEKGKVPEKRQHLQQQFERGSFSPCSSPSGLDSREPYDLQVGAKMMFSAQDMLLRRKLEEQADLHQAIELQRRRFVNLQLPDLKNDGFPHHQRSLSVGAAVSLSYSHASQNFCLSDSINQEASEVNSDNTAVAGPSTMITTEQEEVNSACDQKGGVKNTQDCSKPEGCHDSSVQHALPDSPFASPKKSTENHLSDFPALVEVNGSSSLLATSSSENDPPLPISSASNMASIRKVEKHIQESPGCVQPDYTVKSRSVENILTRYLPSSSIHYLQKMHIEYLNDRRADF